MLKKSIPFLSASYGLLPGADLHIFPKVFGIEHQFSSGSFMHYCQKLEQVD
jgi:hypothetical protein